MSEDAFPLPQPSGFPPGDSDKGPNVVEIKVVHRPSHSTLSCDVAVALVIPVRLAVVSERVVVGIH